MDSQINAEQFCISLSTVSELINETGYILSIYLTVMYRNLTTICTFYIFTVLQSCSLLSREAHRRNFVIITTEYEIQAWSMSESQNHCCYFLLLFSLSLSPCVFLSPSLLFSFSLSQFKSKHVITTGSNNTKEHKTDYRTFAHSYANIVRRTNVKNKWAMLYVIQISRESHYNSIWKRVEAFKA